MKNLPKFVRILLFAFYFLAGFTLAFKLITPYIEAQNTISVENNPSPYFEVLVFTQDDVQFVELRELENFKRQNTDYSFLVPTGREDYFAEKLHQRNEGLILHIDVGQIYEDRQLIRASIDSARAIVRNTYEATDKEVFPKTTMWLNFRYTPLKFLISSLGGALACLFFYFIYRKYLTR